MKPRSHDTPRSAATGARASRPPVAALDPTARYGARLSARSALYTELQVLLTAAAADVDQPDYRALVIERNCLARPSSSARAKLWEELKKRYRLDSADPLFAAFLTEWRRAASEREQALTAYVFLALNDRFIADLGTEWLYPRLVEAPADLRVGDVLAFIEQAKKRHPEVDDWSPSTRHAVAQKYCASIRDFGLARGVIDKTTVRPALYGAPVRLIIRALRLASVPLLQVAQSPLFRLVALGGAGVVDGLVELHRLGQLHFRMQGDIVELDVSQGAP